MRRVTETHLQRGRWLDGENSNRLIDLTSPNDHPVGPILDFDDASPHRWCRLELDGANTMVFGCGVEAIQDGRDGPAYGTLIAA